MLHLWHKSTIHRHLPDRNIPYILMGFNELRKLEPYHALSSSHCVLVSYRINSIQDLINIFEFGSTLIHHKRLSLILQLGKDISLEVVPKTNNASFLVAAELDDGRVQFLCPIVGDSKPRLQEQLCDFSYTTLEGSNLRVGMFGVAPYVYSESR